MIGKEFTIVLLRKIIRLVFKRNLIDAPLPRYAPKDWVKHFEEQRDADE